jgi:hypothetical protein
MVNYKSKERLIMKSSVYVSIFLLLAGIAAFQCDAAGKTKNKDSKNAKATSVEQSALPSNFDTLLRAPLNIQQSA